MLSRDVQVAAVVAVSGWLRWVFGQEPQATQERMRWVSAGVDRDGAEKPNDQGPTSTPGDDGPAESTTSAEERRRP